MCHSSHYHIHSYSNDNGIGLMKPLSPEISIEIDSCLSACGGVCGKEYYHTTFPQIISDLKLSICHLLNAVIAVKLCQSHCANLSVIIYSDNTPTVCVLATGRGRDTFLLQCTREIWLQTVHVTHNITLTVAHKPGRYLI